jgi:predicted pyridoxine 5'-phosphate oxidase superfamily flavin-nucleotide-binding protein
VDPERYHAGSRELQDRFDTRRLADRLDERNSRDHIQPEDAAFIERMDMFFLATADSEGRPQCSYKGGDPGFVRVLDEHTLAFPNYDGNGMYLSWGNALVNPHVGLLFIDFVAERPSRLRVEGEASVALDDELAATWPEAQFVVRVRASSPTARATSTAWRSSRARPTSRAPARRRRCRSGSAARSARACCPPAIRRVMLEWPRWSGP